MFLHSRSYRLEYENVLDMFHVLRIEIELGYWRILALQGIWWCDRRLSGSRIIHKWLKHGNDDGKSL